MKRVAVLLVLAGAIGLGLFATNPARIIARFSVPAELYQGRAIVTGQRDETRIPGFERALVDVVRKLTGDARVTADQIAKSMDRSIPEYVESYSEADRMAGIPIHDEQGTRDRPFDLLVTFKPGAVDDLIQSLGMKSWAGIRPMVFILLKVTTDKGDYVLSEDDEERGLDQRDALRAAAWTAGLQIMLPSARQVARGDLEEAWLLRWSGADHLLVGDLTWKSGMKGWQARWRLQVHDSSHEWGIDSVNFDEAFRNAMQGAASILSGHVPIAGSQS
jgi:uncharacterized protein